MSFLIFKEIIQHPIYFVVCHGIQCYICENQLSNDMCSSEVNLEPCEEGMDTCQTIVSYSGIDGTFKLNRLNKYNYMCMNS